MRQNKAFTLIELLIVIGIISILAAAVIVAINPGRQFAQARDATRNSHLNGLHTALLSYQTSNQGSWEDINMPSELTEICNTNLDSPDCTDLVDISALTPDYINQIPVDPQGSSDPNGTGYFLDSDANLVAGNYETDFVGIGITESEYTSNTPDPEDTQWAYNDCTDFEDNGSFSGGSGSESDPYQITDLHQLQAISCDTTSHYALQNNINALGTESWDGGSGWYPIQATEDSGNGSLDGGGYVVSDLYINRSSTDEEVGLFGEAQDINLTNIGLENPDITGGSSVTGALAGSIWISVEGSYVLEGSILGGSTTGGLLGNSATDSVTNCFSSAQVDGSSSTGGLVGFLDGSTVNNSYSTGLVDSNNTASDAGGLIGSIYEYDYDDTDSYITNSYWDSEISGQADGVGSFGGSGDGAEDGAKGRTTDQLQTPTAPDATVDSDDVYTGWDDAVWNFGTSSDYPTLHIFD